MIIAQLEDDGGYEALLYHLLHEIEIKDFNVRAVPKTAMLLEQAEYSRRGVDLLVEIACNTAHVPCPHSEIPDVSVCSGYDQRAGFDYFVDHHSDRELSRMGSLSIKRRLAKDWGCITGQAARTQRGGARINCVRWPPLKELREKFTARYGSQIWLVDAEKWQKEDF
jgi:hypothetical protein